MEVEKKEKSKQRKKVSMRVNNMTEQLRALSLVHRCVLMRVCIKYSVLNCTLHHWLYARFSSVTCIDFEFCLVRCWIFYVLLFYFYDSQLKTKHHTCYHSSKSQRPRQISESKLKGSTCGGRKVREKMFERVTVGLGFTFRLDHKVATIFSQSLRLVMKNKSNCE